MDDKVLYGLPSGVPMEIALFDGERQVTEWRPYDAAANTPVHAPEPLTEAALVVRRARDGVRLFRVGTWRLVRAGEPVQLPDPSGWSISAV
jgi:hypothetical protein